MINIIEAALNHYALVQVPLYRLRYDRGPSDIEVQEQPSLLEREPAKRIRLNNRIEPAAYNALNNKGYKRNAPEVVPRIIHQIFLSDQPLSEMQKRFTASILEKHPGFKYRLWTSRDLTRENFPMTFDMIQRILNYDRHSKYNFKASVAGILRM